MAQGYIRKRGNRSWQLAYDAPRGVDGKRRQRYETVRGTKRQAQARLTEILQTLNKGDYREPTAMTVADYLDLWLRDYAEVSVRPRTLQGYRSLADSRIKPALGHIRLRDLSALHVQTFYANLLRDGLTAYSVVHHHRLLRQALKYAVRWELLPRNITDGVTPPSRTKPDFRALNAAEIQALTAEAEGTDYHLPIHLAIYTGLRRSEILGLRWQDVDMRRRALSVRRTLTSLSGDTAHWGEPKTQKSRRTIAYGEETSRALSAQMERGAPVGLDAQVCLRANGALLLPDSLSQAYRRIALKCGIADVRFHDLRHTHATMLLESGVPAHIVQARLGHESIQTTVDIYGHVLPSSDAEASAAFERVLDTDVGKMWAVDSP